MKGEFLTIETAGKIARLERENQDFVVEQNALAYYLVKQGLSFEDVVKIINDFKNE